MIINGAMNVAQRATSVTGIGGSSGYHVCDRWRIGSGTTAGRLTMTQESDGPSGFANCTKLACTTADTSIAAGESLNFQQIIEGQDLQRICKGTSDAKELTFSFYVKGNAAATYTVELFDASNSRQISKTFSVTTAWTRVSLTYPADTTGAFTDSNAAALYVVIWLHAGSDVTSGTLNSTSWAANVEANRVSGSQTSFLDSTARTFFITGVQLEVGDTATPFEHRSYGHELERCQRYFYKESYGGSGPFATQYEASHKFVHVFHPTTMRSLPTSTVSYAGGTMSEYQSSVRHFKAYISSSTSDTTQRYLTAYQADAEL
tara:strand:- start:147 stop:1100 length:954 start_codon:yes stop_codon:yes gene_type:complete